MAGNFEHRSMKGKRRSCNASTNVVAFAIAERNCVVDPNLLQNLQKLILIMY